MSVKSRPWSVDDHPIPSCFFVCIGYLTGESLDRQWWGHRFLDVPGWTSNSSAINLASEDVRAERCNGGAERSPVYQQIRQTYGIEISVRRHVDVVSYLDDITGTHPLGMPFLIPMPLCRVLGFEGLERPTHHYAICKRIDKSKFEVFDQYRSVQLTRRELGQRLQWFLRYGYISHFQVKIEPSRSKPRRPNISLLYQQSLEEYQKNGAELLDRYVEQAQDFAARGELQNLPVDSLYTITLCLRSEQRFLAVHDVVAAEPLQPILATLARDWRGIVLRSMANVLSGKVRFDTIPDDLRKVAADERVYFETVQAILDRNKGL